MASAASIATVDDARRWSRNLQLEVDGAAIYGSLARSEPEHTLAALYARLATAESRHARLWAKKLRDAGVWQGMPKPSRRAAFLMWVAGRLGPDIVGRSLAAREAAERATYEAEGDAASRELGEEERFHAWLLGRVARARLSGTGMARLGNALRAAVLGMNDGLVANLSLVMGVAGAGGDAHAIVVAGLAGLLAGSLSMGLGEYLSVQTSRELFQRHLVLERDHGQAPPDEATEVVALILESKGVAPGDARRRAEAFVTGSTGTHAARAQADAEVGDLGGSAWIASLTSFAMYGGGAAIPLIPFAFGSGAAAQIWAVIVTGLALFANGSMVTLVTAQPVLRAGLRQASIGFAAALITYTLGRLFSVAFG